MSFQLCAKVASKRVAKEILLTKDNFVQIKGGIGAGEAFNEELFMLSARLPDSATIYVVLNSPGGSMFGANDMHDALEAIPQRVETISIFAASAAFHIAQMGIIRYVVPSGVMMQHRESGGLEGNFDQMRSILVILDLLKADWTKLEAKRIGISEAEYTKKIENDWWGYGPQAISEGMADEIATLKCSKDILNLKKTILVPGFFGASEKEVPVCPLVK